MYTESVVAFEAMKFAREVHKNQKRKYINTNYSDHLAEVAGIVSTVEHNSYIIATAWLHDCIEDQNVSVEYLKENFGSAVAYGVNALSDLEQGNRKTRKELARKRLSEADGWVQTIKAADIISNTYTIVEHDKKFAELYLKEAIAMLDVLNGANRQLVHMAHEIIRNSLTKLNKEIQQ